MLTPTEKFSTPNCSGNEKVEKINKEVNMDDLYAFGYGNLADDIQMLDISPKYNR